MITYRYATPADAPLLAPMNHRLIRDAGYHNPMSVAQLEERMRGYLGGEYQAVIFEDQHAPVGYALFKQEPEWVYLRHFFVEPQRRRNGIGRAAIQWLLTQACKGAGRVQLDVLAGNAAGVAFWRSVGFADYCLTMERTV